jgi:hypothetical protein
MDSRNGEYQIHTPEDMMRAKAQGELNAAKKVLEDARRDENYYREKIALKLHEFQEAKEHFIDLYIEGRLYYPELSELMEDYNPFFG